jgi:hypothetical protein
MPITITDGASLTLGFGWMCRGEVITVTAMNLTGPVVETHNVSIEQPISGLTASNDGPTMLRGAPQHERLRSLLAAMSLLVWTGDGSTASGQVVSHTYITTGTYTATVTAHNLSESAYNGHLLLSNRHRFIYHY